MLAVPFAQYFAFVRYQTWLSFLLPLVAASALIFVVLAFSPRYVLTQRSKRSSREGYLRVSALAAALALVLVLPSTGLMVVLRGAFTDILAFVGLSYLIRRVQRSRTPVTDVN
jgi:hypothetical protein